MRWRATSLQIVAWSMLTVLPAAGCSGAGHASVEPPTQTAESVGLPQGAQPVELDPAGFSTDIDNPYWPMTPGTRWTYRETDERGSG